MIKSMTGYGKAEAILETGKITVEVRSLNGKTADISLKTSMLPKDKEMTVRQKIAAELTRGNIDFFITFEPNAADSAKKINMALAMEYYQFHPKWNAYLKGAYETASVYRTNGDFQKGRYLTSWNAQACLEWFPFTQDKGFKVFAHYVYNGNILSDNAKTLGAAMPDTQRISLGIQYIIPVL